MPKTRVATMELSEANGSGVSGTIFMTENNFLPGVEIFGQVNGLAVGPHGFHVHTNGAISNNCADAGGHFNPFAVNSGAFVSTSTSLPVLIEFQVPHGAPHAEVRHIGDFGNIQTDSATMPTMVNFIDRFGTLEGSMPNTIAGRAIVVHAGEDDLGLGGNPGSVASGNAGSRVACGVIVPCEFIIVWIFI